MKQPALLALVAATAIFSSAGARADGLDFFDVHYDSTAIALTSDGPVGIDSRSGTGGVDAVSTSAASIGSTDVATAGSFVSASVLTTSADIAATAIGNAVATTNFSGSFINGASVNLALDFTGLNTMSGSGEASTTLFVNLSSNGATLFSDYVAGPWTFSYAPTLGSASVLSLTLSSQVDAAFLTAGAGNASSVGVVAITGAVPETSTWLLMALGLGMVGAVARGRRRRIAATAP